jgi:LuxR family transcriptional regulator, maltose regulon positive regulatory protein
LPGQATERRDPPLAVAAELVATKLVPPRVRDGYIPRKRLIDALAAGRDARLTLVDAPTGYGKTMLVAAWFAELAEQNERGVAWLSLAATENDPALFTRYLIGALRHSGLELGGDAETMLQVPGASPLAWMHTLVNDLATAEAQTTLALDDYHLITEPACHALVQFLLDHAPDSLHVLVSTRADPPIALGSLRAAGQLVELRVADLRFTAEEAGQLLIEREGLRLPDQTVASLAARTEGWAAGLYLAALWLRGQSSQEADAERFAGDNRHVVDYLSEAVLEQLSDDVRKFLLETSVADRLCTSLADAITEQRTAGLLQEIERSNLFLVPLDDTRTWYRYHHLFRQMLRGELARRHPELVASLHARASAWYRERGLIPEAIDHATAAGDPADAAAMISEHWLEVGRWGQEATVKRWLEAFGPDELRRYPELCLAGAFLTGVSGGSESEFRRWLELAELGAANTAGARNLVAGNSSLSTGVSLLRSAFGYRNVHVATATAARTVRVESEAHGLFRVAALGNLAFLLYLTGDLSRARHAVSEAMRDPQAERRPYGFITALTASALIALDEGDTDPAERAAQRALEYAARSGLAENQVSGLAHVAVGRSLAIARRFKPAAEQMQRSLELLRGGTVPASHAYALLWAAPILQACGDHAGALRLLDEAEQLLASFEDAGTLSALLEDVQRRVSLGRPRRQEADSAALTEAELEVVRQLRSPRSQRAIADELSVSINTVKTHTSSIYRKLGVSSRDDAVTRAIDLGLI